ncbi:major facilitator superfamily domain-containing protein [Dendryphion nanum]|uniref:Major facilitator superfamily domain-containing protein n=1 Tax=Dendryphion nanum TaxID=256645 RepID=A0A9P9D1K4_9PLEO|nr:major facilitator superfamily domain-containing protein [Dendryphion nanum]
MSDFIRDTSFEALVRLVTRNRVLKYPEELSDFQLPAPYTKLLEAAELRSKDESLSPSTHSEKSNSARPGPAETDEDTFEPKVLADGTIIVDWYGPRDLANPQNWTLFRKLVPTGIIVVYTFAVYLGSSIFTSSYGGVIEQFGVSQQAVSLTLSMYVLAYGIGPMLFSPLTEIPSIGRGLPYTITLAIFVILLVPTALVNNFPGLVILRFLLGFFGSPCLATGPASLGDMFPLDKLPYAMSFWAFVATSGPAVGPLISGYSVPATNWRWSSWEMLWLSGPVLIGMFFFVPETSPSTILLRRAQRLRARTGQSFFKSQGEIDQSKLRARDVVFEALWRPIQTMIFDPSIGFTALYSALIYGVYYSFFECFPLVYGDGYGFSLGQQGLVYLSIGVGVLIGMISYQTFIRLTFEPAVRAGNLGPPEDRLVPALFASFLLPIGLFIFAWTATPDIHWIVSVIGVAILSGGIYVILQCIFLYLPFGYPQYAASLFAGNDFARSTLAAGTTHFSQPLYHNLGVARGVTLLAGLTVGCIGGLFLLWRFGATLRARSRFAP